MKYAGGDILKENILLNSWMRGGKEHSLGIRRPYKKDTKSKSGKGILGGESRRGVVVSGKGGSSPIKGRKLMTLEEKRDKKKTYLGKLVREIKASVPVEYKGQHCA